MHVHGMQYILRSFFKKGKNIYPDGFSVFQNIVYNIIFGHGVGSPSSHARHARYSVFFFHFLPLPPTLAYSLRTHTAYIYLYTIRLPIIFYSFFLLIINRTVDGCGR